MKRFLLILLFFSANTYAGVAGWNFTWWDCCGTATGVVSEVNWSNVYTGSGYRNYLSGYVKWPGTIGTSKTINFKIGYDDGHRLDANGITVASGPCCGWRYGSVTANSGDLVKLEFWSDNYGGGPYSGYVLWDPQGDGTYETVNSASIATTADYWTPPLAGGASSAAFIANPTYVNKITTFTNRGIKDTQVYVEQIGNSNTILINQTGTPNNYVSYVGNGSNNTVTVNQAGNNSTTANYVDLKITGDSNTANLTQTSTGGTKGIFATINNNNNSLIVQQKDSGSHYLDVIVSGGNKNIDVLQQGSANHMAKIDISGNPINLNLTQSGSTQQFYSIQHTCATAGGCAAITVQQGQ